MTSELGNVTPVIVVPGPWKESDFEYHGMNLASMLTNNAGFNCIATRVLVQHKSWEHRDRLLDSLTEALSHVNTRTAYYPGAESRYERFTGEHPEAERIGLRSDDNLPWTLIRDVPADDPDEVGFATEAFTSVVSEVGLDADDPVQFVADAVAFCNTTLWGTLGATILVHPRSNRRTKRPSARRSRISNMARLRSTSGQHSGSRSCPPHGADTRGPRPPTSNPVSGSSTTRTCSKESKGPSCGDPGRCSPSLPGSRTTRPHVRHSRRCAISRKSRVSVDFCRFSSTPCAGDTNLSPSPPTVGA